jgi:hypothetical protein
MDSGTLVLGEPYLTTVYNFTVDEFHTYYVGEAGVWVHNVVCAEDVALKSIRDTAELQGVCFADGTPVLVEDKDKKGDFTYRRIESIDVGDRVLSRDEITGEMAFKRVLKCYENGKSEIFHIHVSGPIIDAWHKGNMPPVETTPEHPFWVQGKGWTPACDLKPGDELLAPDGYGPVTVDRVGMSTYRAEVFNLEVEDFNTYFVKTGIWVHNCNNGLKGTEVGQLLVKPVEYSPLKPEWSPIFKNGDYWRENVSAPSSVSPHRLG